MRRGAVVIAALAVIAASAAAAGAKPRPVIGCQEPRAGDVQYLTQRIAPGTCTLLFRQHPIGTIQRSDAGKISGTHWDNWGRGKATGKGWLHLGFAGAKNLRATMKAYDMRALPADKIDAGGGSCLHAEPY